MLFIYLVWRPSNCDIFITRHLDWKSFWNLDRLTGLVRLSVKEFDYKVWDCVLFSILIQCQTQNHSFEDKWVHSYRPSCINQNFCVRNIDETVRKLLVYYPCQTALWLYLSSILCQKKFLIFKTHPISILGHWIWISAYQWIRTIPNLDWKIALS